MVTRDEEKFASAVVAQAVFGETPAVERMRNIHELALLGVVNAFIGYSIGLAVRARPSAPQWRGTLGFALCIAGSVASFYSSYLHYNQSVCLIHDHIRALDVIRRAGESEDHLATVSAQLKVGHRTAHLLKGPRGIWVQPHEARTPRWYWLSDYHVHWCTTLDS